MPMSTTPQVESIMMLSTKLSKLSALLEQEGSSGSSGLLSVSCHALTPILPNGETTLLKPTITVHPQLIFFFLLATRRSVKTLIQVSLLPVADEDETLRVVAPEEWTGLPAIKERPTFKFGRLNSPTMDLMMLQVDQTHNLDD